MKGVGKIHNHSDTSCVEPKAHWEWSQYYREMIMSMSWAQDYSRAYILQAMNEYYWLLEINWQPAGRRLFRV